MENLVQKLRAKETALSIIGLGYVGLPIAVAFSKKFDVIGFDSNSQKIDQYKSGVDPTNEVGKNIKNTTIQFTSNPNKLREAKFHIVAVPTPINKDKTPNLTPLKTATNTIGQNLVRGSIVVFESTVYPGLTEEVCIPILEKVSGLTCGEDFKVGYSPERINPGDQVHRLEKIVKLVSGSDKDALDMIAQIYDTIVDAGTYKTSSIKVAEAAKIIENSQRDINIAFMNELSVIFHRMEIDTKEVLEAAKTKWNFLDFTPGLVGGHCIGVDPYYLTHQSEALGYHPEVILAGRKINDGLGKRIAQELVKMLAQKNGGICTARVGIFGITFKQNCPDTRNTKVLDIIEELREFTIDPIVYDPIADSVHVENELQISLVHEEEMSDLDAIVLAVDHDVFKEKEIDYWISKLTNSKIIFDIKGMLSKKDFLEFGMNYWRL
ncbi:UDP-N-acetyl-D-galactosamine dehydrogenase [Enterococcus florum]|uniref:UDP-N-acetyl-D-galactosamine dehydrogenase n=1 Tax=Enterococcus florum TaxID=2480627 RepID=A0A4P5PBM6_9ENTE|nr:nucleotide sugar dehydrogenase [Enterococcus florum]GCF95136.1 UDP-N-acetyl-D-galactosamine dehydrogenase [Enterococcus florum]